LDTPRAAISRRSTVPLKVRANNGWERCDQIHEMYQAKKGEQKKNDSDN
jgi:hypothetical protein